MNCDYCVRALTKALEQLPGVTRATLLLEEEKAIIEHAEGEPSADVLIARVEEEGYGASVR